METTIGLYGKGNEIISWWLLCVGLCFVLNSNCCCMCYHHQSMLHQIYTSRIDNDNICQSPKTIYVDDNIHPSPCMMGENVGNLSVYVNSTLWSNRCNGILKRIMGYNVATPLWPSVGVKPNTSKVGDLESFGTPECLELDSKAQNTSHWGVLGVIGKVLKLK
jgi:hypothetical protein